MPNYALFCPCCTHTSEVTVPITEFDNIDRVCPECGAKMTIVPGTFTFTMKW